MRKKEVYLSNDKAERKASGSYYTPDPIVEYIVAHTVGPVLDEKLEALRPEFRKVRKTFDNELQECRRRTPRTSQAGKMDHRPMGRRQTYNSHKDLVEQLFDLRGARPGDGQRPLPGRSGRFRHRPAAQVPQPVPDQPGATSPWTGPATASSNPSASRASPSIRTS